nr:hypothetical protein [Curtobacterium sp. PhB78]
MMEVELASASLCNALTVGDDHELGSCFLQPVEEGEHVVFGRLVECSGGLIGKDDGWALRDGPSDRDALRFSSRQSSWALAGKVTDADRLEGVVCSVRRVSTSRDSEPDVVEHAAVPEQAVVLGDDADVSEPVSRHPGRGALEHLPFMVVGANEIGVEAGEDSEQRALARSAAPGDGY